MAKSKQPSQSRDNARNSASSFNEYTSNEYTNNERVASQRRIDTFEDLDVWQLCVQIRRDIAELAKSFPGEEKYRLSDQMIRASRSVTANIAESFGRFHYRESVQFCRQARGSLYELIDHLHVAAEQNYLPAGILEDKRDQILRAVKVLNGFIGYLSRSRVTNNE